MAAMAEVNLLLFCQVDWTELRADAREVEAFASIFGVSLG